MRWAGTSLRHALGAERCDTGRELCWSSSTTSRGQPLTLAHLPCSSALDRSCRPPLPPPSANLHPPLIRAQDDDDEHEFSKTLAFDYISQADTTFAEIDGAL